MRRSAGILVVLLSFGATSVGVGCKGKSDNETKAGTTTQDPAPTIPKVATPGGVDAVTPPVARDKPVPKPPVPKDFPSKVSAFYASSINSLKVEPADCKRLGEELLKAMNDHRAALSAFLGTEHGAKWRAANKAVVSEFQRLIQRNILKCSRDKAFAKWMGEIRKLTAKYHAGARELAPNPP